MLFHEYEKIWIKFYIFLDDKTILIVLMNKYKNVEKF
jgi:hypothetical protein